jgi:hypothetical protein
MYFAVTFKIFFLDVDFFLMGFCFCQSLSGYIAKYGTELQSSSNPASFSRVAEIAATDHQKAQLVIDS